MLDVGVVGGGTAGGAAALFLARAGHRVTIYERVPSPTPVGAGITLQPTGMYVLTKLGLYDAVVPRGSRIERLVCEDARGRTLFDLAYAEIDPKLFGLGLHRGVLFSALHEATKREPNVGLRLGVEIVDLHRRSWLVDATGTKHGPHDLIVVADGARSQLRDDTSTSKRVVPYPWGALWFVAKDRRPDGRHVLRQRVDGNRFMLGLLPTGAPGGEPLVSFFWSLRADSVAALRRAGLDAFRAEARRLDPGIDDVFDQIGHVDDVLFAAYHDVVMYRWHTRNVVYLGDAAHATSPQLGQGANLALWDAMVLAECLAADPRVSCALDRYSRTRADHLAFYQLATRWLTPFFQGDAPALGALRDALMPLFARIGPFRRLMTLSMIGTVDGFFGRTLPQIV